MNFRSFIIISIFFGIALSALNDSTNEAAAESSVHHKEAEFGLVEKNKCCNEGFDKCQEKTDLIYHSCDQTSGLDCRKFSNNIFIKCSGKEFGKCEPECKLVCRELDECLEACGLSKQGWRIHNYDKRGNGNGNGNA